MNSLPGDVLLHLAASYLTDAEACRFSQTRMQMQLTLRSRYVLKEPIPATRWKEITPTSSAAAAATPSATSSSPSTPSATSPSVAASSSSSSVAPSCSSSPRAFGRPRLLSVTTDAEVALLTRLDEIAPSAVEMLITIQRCDLEACSITAWRLPHGLQSLTCRTKVRDMGISIAALPIPSTLERLDLSQWSVRYIIDEEAHAAGLLSKFPPTLTELRLPPAMYQQIDGRYWTFPPNLLELHNYRWAPSHPPLPSSLQTLRTLSWVRGARSSRIVFPASLTSLSYADRLLSSDEAPSWSSCPALTELDHVRWFRGLLTSLPSTLTRLAGVRPEQLDAGSWPPAGLLHLAFEFAGTCAVTPSELKWPPRLRTLLNSPEFSDCADYSQLALPETLESVSVSPAPGMKEIRWPKSLREFTFTSWGSGESLDFCWNDGLQILRLSSFNEPLTGWNPPSSLTELYLSDTWNRALTELHLPPRLRLLQFGSCYNKPIGSDDIVWPATLETLRFGRLVDLRQWAPPPNLTDLELPEGSVGLAAMSDLRVPPSMRRFLIDGVRLELVFSPEQWPKLEHLSVPPACVVDWSTVVLPPRLSTLCLRLSSSHAWVDSFVRDFHAPAHLRCILTVRGPHLPLDGEQVSRIRASLPPTCAFLLEETRHVD